MTFSWLIKYFNKQKLRTKSYLKCYESVRHNTDYAGKCKNYREGKEKTFKGKVRTFQPKTNSAPTSSTPALYRESSCNNTT